MFFFENYESIDSISISELSFCKNRKIPTMNSTSGQIRFNTRALEVSLKKSIEKNLAEIRNNVTRKQSWDFDCSKILKNDLVAPNEQKLKGLGKAYSLRINFVIDYHSSKNIDSGTLIETSNDLGNDEHHIKYKLVLALLNSTESIIFMDNRAHWTEVFSERGEQLEYEIPQKIIDSLVTLSLEEYYKRLE